MRETELRARFDIVGPEIRLRRCTRRRTLSRTDRAFETARFAPLCGRYTEEPPSRPLGDPYATISPKLSRSDGRGGPCRHGEPPRARRSRFLGPRRRGGQSRARRSRRGRNENRQDLLPRLHSQLRRARPRAQRPRGEARRQPRIPDEQGHALPEGTRGHFRPLSPEPQQVPAPARGQARRKQVAPHQLAGSDRPYRPQDGGSPPSVRRRIRPHHDGRRRQSGLPRDSARCERLRNPELLRTGLRAVLPPAHARLRHDVRRP